MLRLQARYLARNWAGNPYTLNQSLASNHERNQASIRYLSKGGPPGQPKGFVARVLENVRSEWSSNKEIKEKLEKFRLETEKLEQTEALKQAREKFKKVEAERLKDVNEVLQNARDTLKSGVEKAKEAEIVRKTMQIGDKLSNKAKDAADGISKQGELLRETSAFKKMSEASKTVEKELDEAEIISSLYKAPKELLKRAERSIYYGVEHRQSRPIAPNEEAQSVELHKDSKYSQSWKKFKDDNPFINKLFEFKVKYDESGSPLVRATRTFVDKIGDTFSSMFQTNDLSNALTEICKVDPNFDVNLFLKDCEKFVIPTILEAMCQGRIDILSDWCHEAVFNVITQPHREAEKLGLKMCSKILDLQNVELAMGKIMDQGPVLVITFQAHQLSYVCDKKGNVVEGDADKIVQNTYVMAFCRDQDDLDPYTAWRLIDIAMQQSQFMF